MLRQETIDAFHLMWDVFPGSARIIHKSREISLSNPYAKQNGFNEGCVCVRVGPAEIHKNCKAHLVLTTKETQMIKDDQRIRYWMPLDGYDDYYLHVTIPL